MRRILPFVQISQTPVSRQDLSSLTNSEIRAPVRARKTTVQYPLRLPSPARPTASRSNCSGVITFSSVGFCWIRSDLTRAPYSPQKLQKQLRAVTLFAAVRGETCSTCCRLKSTVPALSSVSCSRK